MVIKGAENMFELHGFLPRIARIITLSFNRAICVIRGKTLFRRRPVDKPYTDPITALDLLHRSGFSSIPAKRIVGVMRKR